MAKNKNSNRPKAKPKQLLLTLRIDEALMDWLDLASIEDRRTRSDYVRLLLEDARTSYHTEKSFENHRSPVSPSDVV
jgi:hypothetical protein